MIGASKIGHSYFLQKIYYSSVPTKPSPCVGIRTCSDYSPFGVELDGRTVSGGYRFGYQGSEKDNEFKGNGNSYTTEFRQIDPRLGRWLSVDPVIQPWQSSFCLMDDNPLWFNDPKGLYSEDKANRKADRMKGKGYKNIRVIQSYDSEGNKTGRFWVGTLGNENGSRDGYYFGMGNNSKSEKSQSSWSKKTLKNITDINNGLSLGLGVQFELMIYSVAQAYKTATNNYSFSKLTKSEQYLRTVNTLGKTGTNILKTTRSLGIAGGLIGIYTKSLEISEKGLNNMTMRDGIDMGVAVTGSLSAIFMASNPVGWGIGLFCMTYSLGTMIYDSTNEE